jgi:predicted metal-binding protein
MCTGGKCLKSLQHRKGAFSIYNKEDELKLVGYTSCGGCPGGNIEYAPEQMIKNGAEVIHLATGMIVGYPPCPNLKYFYDFIKTKYKTEVVFGTHPIPQKYYTVHNKFGTWDSAEWKEIIKHTLTSEKIRVSYD